jgi:D-beta-D-heptose 7-phosphate kinase / D-beta-D-heptose 1-phosphate adenosyltransferase
VSERLVVVGDALLDRDVEGSSERLCPDAPAPVLDERESRLRPGGAGLAAALAASDGCRVTLVTALGPDRAGGELAAVLLATGVDLVDLGLDGPTPEKVRLLCDGRPLLRLDRGGDGGRVLAANGPGLRRALRGADAILVSDYGRGVAALPPVRAALAARRSRTPLVWDPHPRGSPPVPGASLATPNLDEARRLVGLGSAAEASLEDLALRLAGAWGAEAVCITRGAQGALLAVAGDRISSYACEAADGDPCGAGDRFAAAAAAALAAGASRESAIAAAVAAASRFVAASGARRVAGASPVPSATDTGVDGRDLGAAPQSIAPALALAGRVRATGGTVVATGGCFDLLHVGHVRTLERARQLGDCLVVLLNGDRSVRGLKGPERPLIGELERAAMLKALACVDEVAIFDEPVPDEALRLLRPDVWAKGGDYRPEELPESESIASWGGRTAILPYLEGRSTTKLIEEVGDRVGK